MRNKRTLLVLAAAVCAGLLAGVLTLNKLANTSVASPTASSFGQVAVAARYLPRGTVVQQEDVRMIDWGTSKLPAGYAGSAAQLVGRGLLADVHPDEPMLEGKLADRSSGGGLSILIPEGMRAISVKVDDVISVAGFVTPGTQVDVLVTLDVRDTNTSITRTVLQNIRTLAAGQTIEQDREGKPQTATVITLLVTPEEAERLTLASTEGKIQLALRNTLDAESINTSGARTASLFGAERAAPSAAPAPRPGPSAPALRTSERTVVETLRGGVRTLQTF